MKRIFYLLLAITLVLTTFSACNAKSTIGNDDLLINVSVDKRTELLFVIQYLSNYDMRSFFIEDRENDYTRDIDKYFADYKGHEAIKLCESISKSGFTYDAPFSFILNFNDDFTLRKSTIEDTFNNSLIIRCGGIDQVKSFVKAIKDFYDETKFDDFFSKHQDYYKSLLPSKGTINSLNKKIINMIEHFGYKQNSYNVLIADHYKNGWYGPRVQVENGMYDTYCIATTANSIANQENTIMHEFTHSYVNYLADKNMDLLKKSEALIDLHQNGNMNKAYTNWYIIVNEYIVRANVIELSDKNFLFPNMTINKLIKYEKSRGFTYIEEIYHKVKEYHNNRSRYNNFEEFYPQILNQFITITENEDIDLSFKGKLITIDSNYPITVIISTAEKTPEGNKLITDYVQPIIDQAATLESQDKIIKVLTDEQALSEDLSDMSIAVFGTMNGNLWLKENANLFPFTVTDDRITADKVYEGTSLSLATVYQHQDNEMKGIYIFTAQNAEDCITIMDKLKDYCNNDYVIYDGEEAIGKGTYVKSDRGWTFK